MENKEAKHRLKTVVNNAAGNVSSICKILFTLASKYHTLPKEVKHRIISGMCIAIAMLFIIAKGKAYYYAFILGLCMMMIVELLSMLENLKEKNINFYTLYKKWGLFYIFTTCISMVLIRESQQGMLVTIWLFCSVWGLDVFAYIFGKKFGNLQLAPRISPKKTYEGALCGTAGSIIISVLFFTFFHTSGDDRGLRLENFLVLSFVIAIIAQIGDLAESWLKRICGVKDSGSIIPGHGGILDRFDSITMVAPFAYLVLFINNGKIF